jgi:mannose-1-phosphate guanylyltransferase/mannose-6-phosphate isomerase
MSLYNIILAGGVGKRLWPVSTKHLPKQFIKFSQKSFYQKTLLRYTSIIPAENSYLVVNKHNFSLAQQQLVECGLSANFIVEQEAKNTAASCLLAALHIYQLDPNAIICITPTDHYLSAEEKYKELIQKGCHYIKENSGIIVIGTNIREPSSDHGYLRYTKAEKNGIMLVEEFIEKPATDLASLLYKQKETCAWNMGVYIANAKDFINEVKVIDGSFVEDCEKILEDSLVLKEDAFLMLEANKMQKLPSTSIEHCFFSQYKGLKAIHWHEEWEDVGTWAGLLRYAPTSEGCLYNESKNSFLYSSSGKFDKNIITFGIDNLCLIETDTTLFITNKKKVNELPTITSNLGQSDNYQTAEINQEKTKITPWGIYKVLTELEGIKVKLLIINPQGRLSLQYHQKRSEHWMIIKGTAHIELNGKEQKLVEGDSIFVPAFTKHRVSNYGNESLEIIEIQLGDYLEEDDIVRLDDLYGRIKTER